jgi:hypothetical protein
MTYKAIPDDTGDDYGLTPADEAQYQAMQDEIEGAAMPEVAAFALSSAHGHIMKAQEEQIEKLEEEIEPMRTALRPFAKIARFAGWEDARATWKVYANDDGDLTKADFERALEAFKGNYEANTHSAQDNPHEWSYERLETEYRDVCCKLKAAIQENNIPGQGGEKVDDIVVQYIERLQADIVALTARNRTLTNLLIDTFPIIKDMAIAMRYDDVFNTDVTLGGKMPKKDDTQD